uniref:Uncharacterized protein n=1 Tax=Knipowitschia caucasica TaxID=637954 RepID=A0AAV2KDS4_KNICA
MLTGDRCLPGTDAGERADCGAVCQKRCSHDPHLDPGTSLTFWDPFRQDFLTVARTLTPSLPLPAARQSLFGTDKAAECKGKEPLWWPLELLQHLTRVPCSGTPSCAHGSAVTASALFSGGM